MADPYSGATAQPLFGPQTPVDPMVSALMSQNAPQQSMGSGMPDPASMAMMVRMLQRPDPNNPDGVSGNKLFGYHYTGALPTGMSAGQPDSQVPLSQGY